MSNRAVLRHQHVQHDVFALLTDAFQDCDPCFLIMYRFDGRSFNLRRLQAKAKVQTDVLVKLLFADDMADNTNTETKLQGSMNLVSQASDDYNLSAKRLR